MHMLVLFLVHAKSEDDAIKKVLPIMEKRVECGIYDYYTAPRSWVMAQGLPMKDNCLVLPLTDDNAKKILQEIWSYVVREFLNNLEKLKKMISEKKPHELFDNFSFTSICSFLARNKYHEQVFDGEGYPLSIEQYESAFFSPHEYYIIVFDVHQ